MKAMRVSTLFGIGFLVVASAPMAIAENNSKSRKEAEGVAYKWVDEKGAKTYGDYVPPEAAKRERTLLNEQGVEIRRYDAERSPDQIAADAERNKAIESRRQRDQFLLTTYTSVADIEALRDLRLEQIEGQSRAAGQYMDTLNSRLVGLQARAQLFRPYSEKASAATMPENLVEELVRTLGTLRTQKNVIVAKRSERDAVTKQFQSDIDRYRELRATATARR